MSAAWYSTTCIHPKRVHPKTAMTTKLLPVQICGFRVQSLQAHKINESTESARVPGMTPLLAGILPESLPARRWCSEYMCTAMLLKLS